MYIRENDRLIYKQRDKLACGVLGGMPLNMTLGNICRIRDLSRGLLASPQIQFGVVVLGMGDGLVPVLFASIKLCIHVGGVEVVPGPPSAFKRMLDFASVPTATSLYWGTDVSTVQVLDILMPYNVQQVVAYGFDDTIPELARKHWYTLLVRDERVNVVCTCFSRKLDLSILLPLFKVVHRFRVYLEGGKCSRIMIILQRVVD